MTKEKTEDVKIAEVGIFHYLGITQFKKKGWDKLNEISGGNGVNKTAIIKGIKKGLSGKKHDVTEIQIDEDHSRFLIKLTNGDTVARKDTVSGTNLKVTPDVGEPFKKPQKYLNDLMGEANLWFDPTEFYLADKRTRMKMLLSAAPFKLSADELGRMLRDAGHGDLLDGDKLILSDYDYDKHGLEVLAEVQKAVYKYRGDINADVLSYDRALKVDRDIIPDGFDTKKFEGFDINAATEELETMNWEINNQNHREERINGLREDKNNLKNEIVEAEERLHLLKTRLVFITKEGKALKEEIDSFVAPNIDAHRQKIGEYNECQKFVLKSKEIADKEKILGAKKGFHQSLNALYKSLVDDIPQFVISKIKMPITGISFKGEDILHNKIAIDNLSTSEKMKFCCAVARATLGKLKAIFMDRFESLDLDAQSEFVDDIANDGIQYLICTVTSGPLQVESLGDGKMPRRNVKRLVDQKKPVKKKTAASKPIPDGFDNDDF